VRIVLEGHCVEAAARRARAALESRLLERDELGPALREVASDLELLTEFLRSTDFAALRASRPELDGRDRVTVELRRDDAGRITCYTVSSE
jgi:hypothetical protein